MDHVGGLLVDGVRNRLRPDLRIHVAAAEVEFWATPDFSSTAMPSPVPDALRSVAGRFLSARSEEHTSELQSLMRISYAVFCLKKKNTMLEYQATSSTTI